MLYAVGFFSSPIWYWELGPFQLGKIVTKQEILENLFLLITMKPNYFYHLFKYVRLMYQKFKPQYTVCNKAIVMKHH